MSTDDDHGDDLETLRRRVAVTTEARPLPYSLVVLEGPDTGKSVVIDGAQPCRILVGQGAVCDLRLSDRRVSRRHVAFDATPEGLRITDLQSTNGTFVEGLAIFDARLRGGERVRIGDTTLSASPASSPAPRSAKESPLSMSFGRVLGGSAEMRRLFPLCERLAASDVPVVIEGETGTGKELLAEALHEAGPRARGPFVVFDCTAVPPNLLESTLFGHERGSFTGAVASRKGVFELADGGTLFIDEIGDLDIALQAKLLRAIERSEVQRVGGERFVRFDVRVLSATRRDLDREVQAGRFRDDLFFRLAVARIELPPLRSRHGDVGRLARHFFRHLGGGDRPLPDELLARLEDYAWPGNVRELHNTVARYLALGDLAPEPASRRGAPPASAASPAPASASASAFDSIERVLAMDLPLTVARDRILDEFLRRYVERVLARHNGSVARAAAASGVARRYFQIVRARHAK